MGILALCRKPSKVLSSIEQGQSFRDSMEVQQMNRHENQWEPARSTKKYIRMLPEDQTILNGHIAEEVRDENGGKWPESFTDDTPIIYSKSDWEVLRELGQLDAE